MIFQDIVVISSSRVKMFIWTSSLNDAAPYHRRLEVSTASLQMLKNKLYVMF
jgi:hypothetical protein